ncbi:MAG: DUF1499 domain-containing protein, partial [Nitrospirae bacterium]
MRRLMIIGIIGVAVLVVVAFWLLSCWPVVNVVETGKTPEYPDITPRRYHATQATVERVFDAALHAVDRLPRWSLVAYQPETGEIRAEARTRQFRFVDDVLIRVEAQNGEVVV